MANANQAQEPSMEEILASIRRIISDEETTPEADEAGADDEMAAAMAGDSTEMSQDDLDKLFDADGDADIDEPVAVAAEDDAEDDVLELTEDLAIGASEEAPEATQDVVDFDMVDGLDVEGDAVGDVAFVDEPVEEAVPAPEAEPEKAAAPDASGAAEDLLSPATNEAVHNAFNNLAGTVLTNNARTLEDLVKEMLRPMLKSWLDDNLPPLVERLVRQEIERVSRGR